MTNTISLVDAKAHFSECIRAAESGRSLLLTRHGKAVAGLVPAEDLRKLETLRSAGPEAGLAGLAGGWEGSEELAEILAGSARSASRDLPDLA